MKDFVLFTRGVERRGEAALYPRLDACNPTVLAINGKMVCPILTLPRDKHFVENLLKKANVDDTFTGVLAISANGKTLYVDVHNRRNMTIGVELCNEDEDAKPKNAFTGIEYQGCEMNIASMLSLHVKGGNFRHGQELYNDIFKWVVAVEKDFDKREYMTYENKSTIVLTTVSGKMYIKLNDGNLYISTDVALF